MASLFDDPVMLVRYAVNRQTVYRPTSSVYAPCCGRQTIAEAVKDVRSIPNTVVSSGRKGKGVDQDWLCDGCSSRMIQEGRKKRTRAIRTGRTVPNNVWTESKFARAIGEPWSVIRRLRAREIVKERALTENVADFDQSYRAEHDALPEKDIPGTDPPS